MEECIEESKKVVLEMKQFADTKADWICKRTVRERT